MTVATLVREGEGPADNTFFGYALIKRIEGPDQRVRFLPVRLGEALDNGALFTADLALKPRDTLTIYNERDLGELPQVSVVGGVRKPGTYPLTEDMKVSDLIYEAGGLKDNAYLPRAEIARTTVVDGTARYIYQDIDLEQALSDVAGGNPALSRGDMLFIQTASNWHQPSVVLVEGEVLRPGPYAVHEGERLASVIERAGGLRPDAYLPASVFIRQSVQQIEQQRLNEGRARLQEEAARLALAPPQPGQQSNNTAALTTIQQVLASTESQQAVGRVVLHLTTLTTLANSPDDIALENSDRFTIPRRPASINVLGQVYTPTSIVYKPGLTVRDYLEKAGGPTEGADEDHIFVITANGSVLTEAGIKNSEKNMLFPLLPVIGGGLMATKLGPGDTVYVPEKLLYVSGLQYATAVTQIIANSAMALAVVGILGTSI
jgi:protein involved in polysaccharide export with SLBB domain